MRYHIIATGSECASCIAGPAQHHNQSATILYAPNTTDVQDLMGLFARQVACPANPSKVTFGNSFYQYFKGTETVCQHNVSRCYSDPACHQHVITDNLLGFASEHDAVAYATQHPRRVDAAVIFDTASFDSSSFAYTVRMNHTHMPSSRMILNPFDILPDDHYKRYWFFANLQQLIDQAILARATGDAPATRHPVDVKFKPFPWPAVTIDYGASAASIAFNLLLVYAFLAPTRSTVASIVREKELRLREGMRILGLQVTCIPVPDVYQGQGQPQCHHVLCHARMLLQFRSRVCQSE